MNQTGRTWRFRKRDVNYSNIYCAQQQGGIVEAGGKVLSDWLGSVVAWFHISDIRKEQIYTEIKSGSDPRFTYYLLLLLSALIATFGLIANSPTVVIGAMLVCPLMMPIFGISLSLVIGDTRLLRSAMLAEAGGVALVVCASFLVGVSPFTFEITREILNNTSPNLFDLIVAALAGFAGCMALIDERISPILPGIAISTSLTPPLAACGLCFAFGAFEGCLGAFILFLANFLTILFIASLTFMAAGFFKGKFGEHKVEFAKRFSLATISMIVLIFFLTNAMIRLIETKTIISSVKKTMLTELSDVQNLEIKEITLDKSSSGKEVNALVVIDAPKEPTPFHLQRIEKQLQQKLHKPINLFVQTRITRSVSSSRDKLLQFYRSADGIEEIHRPGKEIQALNIASQIVRERMEQIPGMQVTDIELRHAANGRKIIYTTIHGAIRPFPGGIRMIEKKVQDALKDPDIRLVARYIESYEVASDGINVSELSSSPTVENSRAGKLREMTIGQIRRQTALLPQAVKAGQVAGRWVVVAEVSGPTVMTRKQATAIQDSLKEAMKEDVLFMAFSKAEMLVGGEGFKE